LPPLTRLGLPRSRTGIAAALFSYLFSATDLPVPLFNNDAKELAELLLGLASHAGWTGAARVAREGDDYLIALRVRRRPVEPPARELKRRARALRG
jgi:hypothetical protein